MYAKLPDNNRPRCTILFTDGAPFGYYTPFENITDYKNLSYEEAKEHLKKTSPEIRRLYGGEVEGEERDKEQWKLSEMIAPDIRREVRKMRDTYSKMNT